MIDHASCFMCVFLLCIDLLADFFFGRSTILASKSLLFGVFQVRSTIYDPLAFVAAPRMFVLVRQEYCYAKLIIASVFVRVINV